MKNLTIMIQGPLSIESLSHIEQYKEHGEVVVSHWNTRDEQLLDELARHGVRSISASEPTDQQIDAHKGTTVRTFFKAIMTMHMGLTLCETDYVLKVRSDEFYNLGPMIDRFQSHRCTRFVFGNIFYHRSPFHIGDHVFIGNTFLLRDAVARIYNYQHGMLLDYHRFNMDLKDSADNCAEIVLCKSLLYSIKPREQNNIDMVAQHFDIIDINLMTPFLARWRQADKVYKNKFDHPISRLEQVLYD